MNPFVAEALDRNIILYDDLGHDCFSKRLLAFMKLYARSQFSDTISTIISSNLSFLTGHLIVGKGNSNTEIAFEMLSSDDVQAIESYYGLGNWLVAVTCGGEAFMARY